MTDNIFLKIIEGKIPAQIVYEDEHCVAFRDVNPQAPTHVLIIPRKVIPTHDDITDGDTEQFGLQEGYRLVINCRQRAGQTVPHLHMHLLGGRDFGWPPG
jgi:histidine triad (HIT) family protein